MRDNTTKSTTPRVTAVLNGGPLQCMPERMLRACTGNGPEDSEDQRQRMIARVMLQEMGRK